MLRQTFFQLLSPYQDNPTLANELWTEIATNYSNKKRHYHTLQHLENIWLHLQEVTTWIKDRDCILFTLFYHDIIYNPLRSDNEEKSAELAGQRMQQLGLPAGMIQHCKAQVLATKSHILSTDSDTNYFTDADLSVLGQPWEIYSAYCKNIRKEYAIYPDLIYKPGRKKVLDHFLSMDRIFKTSFFYDRFEAQAIQNIKGELAWL